jgi:hypothetical protein
MTTTQATAVPARRKRRWIRWRLLVGFIAVTIAVPVLWWAIASWRHAAQIAAAIAETDRLDPRWRLAEVLADRPPLADEVNGSLQVARAMKALDAPATRVPQFPYDAARAASPNVTLSSEDLEGLRDALNVQAEALAEARKLRTLPNGRPTTRYAPGFITTRVTPIQNAREICTLLHFDVFVRAGEGDCDGALQSAHTMLHCARSLGDEVLLLAFQVRLSCINLTIDAVERVLAQGEVDTAALVELQAAFAEELAFPSLVHSLRGERGGIDEAIQLLDNGTLNPGMGGVLTGRPRPTGPGRWLQDRLPTRTQVDRPAFLRRMNELVEFARLPVERQAAKIDRVMEELEEAPEASLKLDRSLRVAIPANLRLHANLRCVIAALAAERYRHQHGVWPKSLDALVEEGLLSSVPLDPYDGQPMRTKQTDGNLVIYSIGRDRTDNSGTIQRYLERLLARFEPPEGTDLGVRLWDVSKRAKAE